MGSRWSITPDEAHNLAAENVLALLNIQGQCRINETDCFCFSKIFYKRKNEFWFCKKIKFVVNNSFYTFFKAFNFLQFFKKYILVSGGSNSSSSSSPLNEVTSLTSSLPTHSPVSYVLTPAPDHS